MDEVLDFECITAVRFSPDIGVLLWMNKRPDMTSPGSCNALYNLHVKERFVQRVVGDWPNF